MRRAGEDGGQGPGVARPGRRGFGGQVTAGRLAPSSAASPRRAAAAFLSLAALLLAPALALAPELALAQAGGNPAASASGSGMPAHKVQTIRIPAPGTDLGPARDDRAPTTQKFDPERKSNDAEETPLPAGSLPTRRVQTVIIRPDGSRVEAAPSWNGSGLIVSLAGHVLTSAALTGDCRVLRLRRPDSMTFVAERIAADSASDLALLRAMFNPGEEDVARFALDPVPGGAAIHIAGFADVGSAARPVLAAGNLGVTSRAGEVDVRLRAPPSGGGEVVLERRGAVLGMLRGRNATASAQTPQPIATGPTTPTIARFLEKQGIPYRTADPEGPPLDEPAAAEAARRVTVQVVCER